MVKRNKKRNDLFWVAISIFVTVYLIKNGTAYKILFLLGDFQWLGIIFAGVFFTSVFTTAPAMALLGGFAQTDPLWLVALLGGVGAVLGDSIIFFFVRNKVSKSFNHLLTSHPKSRIPLIFKNELFKFFLPFIGALVIASPLPDEIGVAMLGISKMSKKKFLILSFILNSIGIFIIGWLAQALIVN
ncbi:MAG: hypothetical protein V1851_03435 [Patescibacteria group bacterium]